MNVCELVVMKFMHKNRLFTGNFMMWPACELDVITCIESSQVMQDWRARFLLCVASPYSKI